jgi:hypothetical protein
VVANTQTYIKTTRRTKKRKRNKRVMVAGDSPGGITHARRKKDTTRLKT